MRKLLSSIQSLNLYIVTCVLFCRVLCATELLPWYGQDLEIETRAISQMQAYRLVSEGHRTIPHSGCDLFFEVSAGTSFNDLAAELEVIASDSRYRHFGMDCLKLTGRYRWLNDVVADPVSLVTGISISQVFKPGLRNLSSFHHGGIEGEFHLSVGKEHSFGQYWISRYWGVVGVGVADMGYPWIRANVAWEHNYCEQHRLRLFVNSLWGLGYKSLHVHEFHGYGSIGHQLVDIGIRYGRSFERSAWVISLEYAFRAYAMNCPKEVNSVYLSVEYPFGL